ncbi:MAG TPA: hypothetical protein VHW64_03135 [Nocardioides sp.]|uniref:hypothetical protein n=1 Tax=Nocardioides sp. TaxID=35761 RepID=UPI002E34B573|nr:hypothetical protein [Nocardioides sp.]HEX3929671.1 hypothetical protein [Nocardioides sp.]
MLTRGPDNGLPEFDEASASWLFPLLWMMRWRYKKEQGDATVTYRGFFDGPVEIPNPHGYVVRYQVGQVFTDGVERVRLQGSRLAVLRKVEIAGPHRRPGSWEVSDGYPPTKPGLGTARPGRRRPSGHR